MRRSLHTDEEIAFLLDEAARGIPIAEICANGNTFAIIGISTPLSRPSTMKALARANAASSETISEYR